MRCQVVRWLSLHHRGPVGFTLLWSVYRNSMRDVHQDLHSQSVIQKLNRNAWSLTDELRSERLHSCSRNSAQVMKPECLVPRLRNIAIFPTCPCPESDKSTPCIYVIFNVMFSSTPSSSGSLLPGDFPAKTVYAFLLSPLRATDPAHLIIPALMTRITFGKQYIYETPHSAVFPNLCDVFFLTPKYLPHKNILERPPPVFVL